MECAGMFQPVFVLSGCCQGLEIGLDTDAIAFGSVVQKSQSSRKLVMSNTGEEITLKNPCFYTIIIVYKLIVFKN